MCALYTANVERFTRAIARYFPEATKVAQPAGGFVLWVELPGKADALGPRRRALAQEMT